MHQHHLNPDPPALKVNNFLDPNTWHTTHHCVSRQVLATETVVTVGALLLLALQAFKPWI